MKEMTPAELLALAASLEEGPANSYDINNAISALRSYAELVSALHYFNDNYTGVVAMRDAVLAPGEIIAWARALGWKGLETDG